VTSNRVRVAAFWPEDLDRFTPAYVAAVGSLRDLRSVIVPEHARTGFVGEQPVAAAGVVPMWAGVGQGWLLVAADASVPAVGLVRAFRYGLADIVAQGGFWRVQADVRTDFPLGQRLLRMLGFAHEGPLRAYGPDGADFVRLAYVDRSAVPGAV